MIPPVLDDSEFPTRIRQLLALEIDRIVEDLDSRREFLIELWSRERARMPFLDSAFTRWRTLSFADLAVLDTPAIVAVESFYRELDTLRLYFAYTQDMPTTLAERYETTLLRIATYGAAAIDALGGAPPRPVVEFEEDAEGLSLLLAGRPDHSV